MLPLGVLFSIFSLESAIDKLWVVNNYVDSLYGNTEAASRGDIPTSEDRLYVCLPFTMNSRSN